MYETVRLMVWQRRVQRPTILSKIGNSPQNLEPRKVFRCMKGANSPGPPICTSFLDKIIKCADSGKKTGERIGSLKTLFNIFLEHVVELIADLLNKRL